jgi:hypothetical protein
MNAKNSRDVSPSSGANNRKTPTVMEVPVKEGMSTAVGSEQPQKCQQPYECL